MMILVGVVLGEFALEKKKIYRGEKVESRNEFGGEGRLGLAGTIKIILGNCIEIFHETL